MALINNSILPYSKHDCLAANIGKRNIQCIAEFPFVLYDSLYQKQGGYTDGCSQIQCQPEDRRQVDPGFEQSGERRCATAVRVHADPAPDLFLPQRKSFCSSPVRHNGWRIARKLKPSRATVSRILHRAGMNRLRSLDPSPPIMRYENKRPGDLIHLYQRLARPS